MNYKLAVMESKELMCYLKKKKITELKQQSMVNFETSLPIGTNDLKSHLEVKYQKT